MKPYKKYVPSGVEWIGDIPEGWEVKKLKYIALICNGQDYKNVEAYDGEYPVIGSGGEFARAERYLYDKVSVLLGRKGTIDKPLLVYHPFWTVDTMYYTAINKGYSPQYLYYLATTINFDLYQYGSTVPSMSQRDLKEIPFAVPHIDTQTAIADYLDRETARIDKIIKAKETLIELLKEKRTALITHTVTKGLDPNAKMKPSGVKWMGDIPEKWEVKKLKYFTTVKDGTHETPDYVPKDDDSIPLITSKDIDEGVIVFDEAKHISFEDYAKINMRSDVEKYDIIMPMIGTVGNPAIVQTDIAFSIKNVALFKIGEPHKAKHLNYLLNSYLIRFQFDLNNRGGVQQFVSLGILNDLFVIETKDYLPLIDHLDRETTKIDTTIEKTKLSIEKLKEYRTALISACVTGKIDVRPWTTDKEAT